MICVRPREQSPRLPGAQNRQGGCAPRLSATSQRSHSPFGQVIPKREDLTSKNAVVDLGPVDRCRHSDVTSPLASMPNGHIEQLPSGSWRAKVHAGTDPLTGREIRLRRTCKTERATQIELGKLLEQAAAGRQPETAAGRQPETDVTVAQRMDRYAEIAEWDLSTRKANEY
jgi:hypothetical protein